MKVVLGELNTLMEIIKARGFMRKKHIPPKCLCVNESRIDSKRYLGIMSLGSCGEP